MKHLRKRLTYANVMSSIAVFLVLGGATAFAASILGKNTVGSKQIKKNAVTTAKIKNGAVNSAKVLDGSLTGADINLGSVGTVPSATKAGSATSATNATNATNAVNAANATHAVSADVAGSAASPATLASGKTETGVFYGIETPGATPNSGYVSASVSFPFPLAAPPTTHYLSIGASPIPACPGTAEVPTAAPGNFCAYETVNGTGTTAFVDSALSSELQKYGIGMASFVANKTSNSDLVGTWAVTAP
jgi:hypothetical protein